MKMSNFIVGMLFMIMILSTFLMGLNSMGEQYDYSMETTDRENYDTFSEVFDKTSEMQTNIDSVEEKTMALTVDPTLTDIIGAFMSGSLEAIKTAWGSFTIFTSISSSIGQILHLPPITMIILTSMLVIMIIIGVFVSLMVKKDV